jgi:hypothetical protein
MDRSDLPAEFHGPRTFDEAIQTLDALEGDEVTLLVSGPVTSQFSTVELTGTLRRLMTAHSGDAFSIADQPGLYLRRRDFKRAWLATHEENSIVHLTIELMHLTVEVGDPGLLESGPLIFAIDR